MRQARSRRRRAAGPRRAAASALSAKASACTSEPLAAADVRQDRRQRDRLAEHEQDHGERRADEPADEPFEHERPADEPVRRADELHHLDLPPPREDREPDRVRDQERRGDHEQDHGDRGTRARSPSRSSARASRSLPHVHRVPTPGRSCAGLRTAIADRRRVLGLARRHDRHESGSGFVGRCVLYRSGIQLPPSSSASALETKVTSFTYGFALRACRRRASPAPRRRVARAEVDLDLQLLLDVVAPREHPGAERDEQPEQAHPDQDGHRRRDRRREVHAGSRTTPRRRAGATRLIRRCIPRGARRGRACPPSSAITRLRILSTISRSWVTMRIVVPARLMR